MKLRTIIVEDEPLARERLQNLLTADPEIELVAECANGAEAVAQITEHQPDLVFLDIQLPELDGFGVLASLDQEHLPAVIFITAYDRFALKAFEVHALDYLLKPFDSTRFRSALQRAKDSLERRAKTPAEEPGLRNFIEESRPENEAITRLAVKSSGRSIIIKVDEIFCIEAAENYVKVHTEREAHLHRETMKSIESRLPSDRFVRISRTCIVNADQIKEVQPFFNDTFVVILKNGARLNATRTHRDKVKQFLGG